MLNNGNETIGASAAQQQPETATNEVPDLLMN